MNPRRGVASRHSKETEMIVDICLDGQGNAALDTGIGFLNHLLTLFAHHGLFDLRFQGKGDMAVDDHHLVEDLGICLGKAFREALGDRTGIQRYGNFLLPMDETLVMIAVDICGRPYLHFAVEFTREKLGNLSTEMIEEFLRAFTIHSGITLHICLCHGKNNHHIAEAIFKGLGRALKQAVAKGEGLDKIPSTKGMLD